MRRYDDPVEVRRGPVDQENDPEQFLWRGRLWKVRAVLAHWVETGPWWRSPDADAVRGAEQEASPASRPRGAGRDLIAECEVWRVEATRGMAGAGPGAGSGTGVFDLSFDWSEGSWRLARCLD